MPAQNWSSTGASSLSAALRDHSKRVTHLERRRQITSADELLGPGFGPAALQVMDWNSEEASFNGYFFSEVGAINSPNTMKAWIGFTITTGGDDTNERGLQRVWSYMDSHLREYTRTWVLGTTGRLYGAWEGDSDWKTTGYSLRFPDVVVLSFRYRIRDEVCWIAANGQIGATIAANLAANVNPDGNFSNPTLFSMPPEAIPANVGALIGPSGTPFYFDVDKSGNVQVTSGPPSVNAVTTVGGTPYHGLFNYVATTAWSISGSYILT